MRIRPLFHLVVFTAAFILLLPYALTVLYIKADPPSMLMLGRELIGSSVIQDWKPLQQISPALVRSVIAAEDAKFCSHGGIDWNSLQTAIEDAQDGEAGGGGSTITQQLAKNLFLWPGRSYVRKALEVPLALWMDLVMTKRRIMEIYLNVAEWGPSGQFGAEAGARHAFGRSASTLTVGDAALMAAVLPNPRTRSARNPGSFVRRMQGTYMARSGTAGLADCVLTQSR